jgi:hypothetical protein
VSSGAIDAFGSARSDRGLLEVVGGDRGKRVARRGLLADERDIDPSSSSTAAGTAAGASYRAAGAMATSQRPAGHVAASHLTAGASSSFYHDVSDSYWPADASSSLHTHVSDSYWPADASSLLHNHSAAGGGALTAATLLPPTVGGIDKRPHFRVRKGLSSDPRTLVSRRAARLLLEEEQELQASQTRVEPERYLFTAGRQLEETRGYTQGYTHTIGK